MSTWGRYPRRQFGCPVLLKQGEFGIRRADAAGARWCPREYVNRSHPLCSALPRGSRTAPRPGRCCRPETTPTCPRHGPCCRCATGCASLNSRCVIVPRVPCSTAGNTGNSMLEEQHLRNSGNLRRMMGVCSGVKRLHIPAISIAEFPFHPAADQGGRETVTRGDSAADRRPSRSGCTGHAMGP